MSKVTKKKINNSPLWNRLHVVGGDPCLCRLFLQGIIEDAGNPTKRYYDKLDGIGTLRNALSAFAFGDVPDAIVINNPTADQLKLCQQVIEEETLTASALVILTLGDTLDGRSAFTQQAQKRKRITYLDPIEKGERKLLIDHIGEWELGTEQKLDSEARTWLIENAPTQIVKVKSQSGKRDCEVYDLQSMENELDKIIAVKELTPGPITKAELIQLVHFEREVDIWKFIDTAISGDTAEMLKMLYVISESQGEQGALVLLYSQLEFLLGVRCLMDENIKSADVISSRMTLQPYIGRYLLEDWSELENAPEPAPPNAWRIRKSMEKPLPEATILSRNYQFVISAIRDLRSGLTQKIVFPYLAFALSGKADYTEPLIGSF
jgi:DNA polymerase III delta subunit